MQGLVGIIALFVIKTDANARRVHYIQFKNRLKVADTAHNTLTSPDLKASRLLAPVTSGGRAFHRRIPDGKKDPL